MESMGYEGPSEKNKGKNHWPDLSQTKVPWGVRILGNVRIRSK